jgi:predicted nucleotidyltransferase
MAGSKVWIALFNGLSEHLEPEIITWAHAVEAKDPDHVHALLVPAPYHINSIIALTMTEPPENFGARPAPLRWYELPIKDRTFLQDAASRAANFAPGSDLWLFGSRATGEAKDDSDFDVRLIAPDDIPEQFQRLARAEVWLAAKDHAVRIDRESIEVIVRSEFDTPDLQKDVLLIFEIKNYGLRVPSATDGVETG